MEAYKASNLEEASGEPQSLLPVPAVHLVSSEGAIWFRHANPDRRVRPEPDILIAAARAAVK